jgi:hypothetical protein
MACPWLGVPPAVLDGCANDRQTSEGGTMGGRKGSSCPRSRRVTCCAYWGRGAGGPGSRRGHYGYGFPGHRREPGGPSSAERPERAGAGGRSHRAGHPRGGRCGLCQLITEAAGSLSWHSICPGTALSARPRAGPGDGNLGAAPGERPVRGCAARPSAEPRQLPMFLFVRCSRQVNKFRQNVDR